MDEIPAPGRRSAVAADDFRRFVKWATEDKRLGLEGRHLRRLHNAAETVQILDHGPEIAHATEGSLRPLRWMVTNDYTARTDEVWMAATQLAGAAV